MRDCNAPMAPNEDGKRAESIMLQGSTVSGLIRVVIECFIEITPEMITNQNKVPIPYS